MEKKSVILELSCELVDKIDRLNTLGDRSAFITHLLEQQIEPKTSAGLDASTELTTRMTPSGEPLIISGEINLLNSSGASLGKFDINTLEGFENLAKKIKEVSENPVVQIRAEHWI
jgi:hypothetical protein